LVYARVEGAHFCAHVHFLSVSFVCIELASDRMFKLCSYQSPGGALIPSPFVQQTAVELVAFSRPRGYDTLERLAYLAQIA
jgi:hypothetical protein